ncbi:methyltransferase domain-containing protein [Jidongwangia harbinensis]|uniref:methyltransferase domain-containing protein n=1 Tax=Jidongwangia harbinensis TaxID=2878561 RepID=UPI001CDA4EE6|nr:methyltransferase domain-containing protein [Jidongwangia harbinensis]MCA2217732.1 methyltransferase domain-containing protein [Jidongwangia harbinensis]
MEAAGTHHTPFTDVDTLPSDEIDWMIGMLDRMSADPEIRRVREVARAALRPAPGQRLLDVGCGAGDVARDLAARVRPGGSVVALDYSASTIAVAERRHDGGPVEYRTGDAQALDLPDDSVDGVWCERVVQHLPDPDAALAEFARVTRPGGRVCVIDTDWQSLALDGVREELYTEVLQALGGLFTKAATGRSLRRRMLARGLGDLAATPVTLFFGTPESAAAVLPFVDPAAPTGPVTWPEGLRERWLAEVERAGAAGEFLAVLTIWVAVGTVR